MLAIGGLKAAAKRTAFGDVSNTVKNLSSASDDSAIVGKHLQEIIKSVAAQEKPAAFLRPAQRPLNNAAARPLTASSLSDPISTFSAPKAPLVDTRRQAPGAKLTLPKNSTSIYKDSDTENIQSQQNAVNQPVRQESAPVAPVHQSLGPRQPKSQPQLKQEQQSRHTQSKILSKAYPESVDVRIPSDPVYEDAPEELEIPVSDAGYESYSRADINESEGKSGPASKQDMIDRLNRQLPAPPLVSEPEEYWEDEEEETYDEQGYTTAHSYRSRGDNTTGGATTVLFPKVTKKIEREIEAARNLVEKSRTQEEIDDEMWDTSMVAEYGDEIFTYMRELEVSS